MRVYVLALSKYLIAGDLMLFALLSVFLLRARIEAVRSGESDGYRAFSGVLGGVQIALIVIFMGASYGTLGAAMKLRSYFYLGGLQAAVLLGACLLFRLLFEKGDHLLFRNMCMMLAVGTVIQTRLSLYLAVRQFAIVTICLAAALLLPFLRKALDGLREFTLLTGGLGIVLLAAVLLLGTATNGSKLTWSFFGVTFQPSEFAKLTFLFFAAASLAEQTENERRKDLIIAAVGLAHVGILILSRDLGSGAIFYAALVLMMFVARGSFAYLFTGIFAGGAGFLVCLALFRHVRVRMQAFLDPWSVIESVGYQITQSLFAISYGGVFGAGLRQGAPENIPYVESDFIFAAIAEEMGLAAAVSLIVICVISFLLILWLALNMADKYCQMLAYGAGVMYIFQTFLTIGGETKFIPLTGVTLPFVSYGGSSVMASILLFTIVQIMEILQKERIEAFEERFERERRASAGLPPEVPVPAEDIYATNDLPIEEISFDNMPEEMPEPQMVSNGRRKPGYRRENGNPGEWRRSEYRRENENLSEQDEWRRSEYQRKNDNLGESDDRRRQDYRREADEPVDAESWRDPDYIDMREFGEVTFHEDDY